MNPDVISAEDKQLIQQLRDRVGTNLIPYEDTDFYLRKWLRARKHNVDDAEQMLKKHVKFVQNYGLDSINDDFIPNPATAYFHTARLGYDKDGSVVRILNIGAADLRGLALSISKIDAFRFAAYLIRSDIKQQLIDRAGKLIDDKQVYVFDLEGLNWASVIHRTVAERAFSLLKNYEANFPENLKAVYVVHAPSFFTLVYSWIKTVVPDSILAKVEIVSYDNIEAVVTKNIDPSILPKAVGGTMVDPDGDPRCPSLYKMPLNSTVPEEMMLYQKLNILENDPTAKRATVECGCACRIRVDVKEANAMIAWDFQTNGYDICFGLCYREDDKSDPSEIITPHRVESHRVPESGTFKCMQSGLYELVFDNTYSWMTSKEVIYKVQVLPPNTFPESLY